MGRRQAEHDTEAILAQRSRRDGKKTLASCVKYFRTYWKSMKPNKGDGSSFVDADHTCGVQVLVPALPKRECHAEARLMETRGSL